METTKSREWRNAGSDTPATPFFTSLNLKKPKDIDRINSLTTHAVKIQFKPTINYIIQ